MKNHLSAVFQPTPHGWNILISKSVGKRCPPKSQETDIVQALVKTKWIRGRLGTVGQRTNNFTVHLLYNELSFTKPWDELVCLEKIAASGKQKKKNNRQTNKQTKQSIFYNQNIKIICEFLIWYGSCLFTFKMINRDSSAIDLDSVPYYFIRIKQLNKTPRRLLNF